MGNVVINSNEAVIIFHLGSCHSLLCCCHRARFDLLLSFVFTHSCALRPPTFNILSHCFIFHTVKACQMSTVIRPKTQRREKMYRKSANKTNFFLVLDNIFFVLFHNSELLSSCESVVRLSFPHYMCDRMRLIAEWIDYKSFKAFLSIIWNSWRHATDEREKKSVWRSFRCCCYCFLIFNSAKSEYIT